MRAILCRTLGQPLTLEELPSPVVGPGQVRIETHAAGVNFADSLITVGKYQEKPPLPFVPGFEIAGTVAEIGDGVTGFAPGDRVMALTGWGGFAEEAVVGADAVFKIPDVMSFEAAAGFPIAYGTSHGALDWRAQLQPGEILLVHGAAGGVGLTAVEIGKAMGATVIATASSAAKLEIAKSRGADHLIDYSTEDVQARVKEILGERRVDVAYDPVGGSAFEASLRTIAWEGRILIIGFAGGTVPQIPANILLVKNCSVIGFYWSSYRTRDPARLRGSFETLLGWVAEGRLQPLVSETLPLERTVEAIERLKSRQATGKVVVTMGRPVEPPKSRGRLATSDWPQFDGRRLEALADPSFVPKVERLPTPPLGYVMSTERCELSCVMCHFNGPRAERRGADTLDPAIVLDILKSRPKGDQFWFVATGEFFSDPNALLYIRTAAALGISPSAITHGQLLTPEFIDQLLEAGLKQLLVSVDSIDPVQYARIRRGGTLSTILDAFAYLRLKRLNGTEITFGVSAICFAKNKHSRQEVEAFWSNKVDFLQFVSEYYDVFRLRRLFFVPERRTQCRLEIIPLPSGRAAPCCAVAIHSHDHDVSWLPDLAQVDVATAYERLCDMYEDPASPLAALCRNCEWWTQFHVDERGNTPIFQRITFETPGPQ